MRKGDTAEPPGEWLLTVRCDCGDWFVIGPSGGPTAAVTLPAQPNFTCDTCGRSARYGFGDLRHSRVAQRAPAPAARPAPLRLVGDAPGRAASAGMAARPGA